MIVSLGRICLCLSVAWVSGGCPASDPGRQPDGPGADLHRDRGLGTEIGLRDGAPVDLTAADAIPLAADLALVQNTRSLLFDGVDDRLAVKLSTKASDPLLRTFTMPLTVELWVKAPPGSGSVVVVEQAIKYSSSTRINFRLSLKPGVECRSEGPGTIVGAVGGTNVRDGKWHHLACTSDGKTLRVLVDGIEDGHTGNMDRFPVTPSAIALTLVGRSSTSTLAQAYVGHADELRIWSVGRGANEIQSLLHRSLAGAAPGLLGCYGMNEGSGQVVQDLCGANGPASLGGTGQTEAEDPAWSTEVPPSP